MEVEDIPPELVALVDARAGRAHKRDGVVMSAVAELLTAYDRLRELEAARVAGTVGDVLGRLDGASVDAGRLAGRVETLLWMQSELQLRLAQWKQDQFADTRAIVEMMGLVRDSLVAVQDGSGSWAGLVRTVVGDEGTGKAEGLISPGD